MINAAGRFLLNLAVYLLLSCAFCSALCMFPGVFGEGGSYYSCAEVAKDGGSTPCYPCQGWLFGLLCLLCLLSGLILSPYLRQPHPGSVLGVMPSPLAGVVVSLSYVCTGAAWSIFTSNFRCDVAPGYMWAVLVLGCGGVFFMLRVAARALENEFEDVMLENYSSFDSVVSEIRRLGALCAAGRMVQRVEDLGIYEALVGRGRRDSTVEEMMQKNPWKQLFTKDQRKVAAQRLAGTLSPRKLNRGSNFRIGRRARRWFRSEVRNAVRRMK